MEGSGETKYSIFKRKRMFQKHLKELSPARWIRLKLVSFESLLLEGELRRFSAHSGPRPVRAL
jgi:hypothetical protein